MEVFQDYIPAQERIDILNAAIERATEMENDVIKNSRYCEVCKKYYFKKICHIDSRKVIVIFVQRGMKWVDMWSGYHVYKRYYLL